MKIIKSGSRPTKKASSKSTNTTKKAETNTKQKHFRITVHTENDNAQKTVENDSQWKSSDFFPK